MRRLGIFYSQDGLKYHKDMKQQRTTHWLASVLAGFGYTSVLLQWLWVGVLFLPSFLENTSVKNFLLPETTGQPTPHIELSGPPIVLTITAAILTLVVLALTVVILVRLPNTIAKTGRSVTEKAASASIPLLTRHRTLPAKKRRELTMRIVNIIKLSIVILPVCLLALLSVVPVSIDGNIAVFVETFLAIGSIAWFSAEYAVTGFRSKNSRT